ncbi:hypothetical protein WMY93_011137 [Mugilogobius chulae]|uniref:PB1 domain-containing protein n=1 Tax=Mugilogobius chulae TaxID=88201 RepID=A0AAW0PCW0_9GOBI
MKGFECVIFSLAVMFLKVRCQSTKKYVKFQSGCSYQDFIAEVKSKFGFPDSAELLILDETDTEIEEDVFVELVEANPDLCLKIEDRLLDKSLSSMDNSSTSSLTDTMSPSSDNEPWSPPRQNHQLNTNINRKKSLSHRSRRQLVNLIVSEMTERHGRMPSRKQKENYALGIITAFPSLRDPFSQKGYEHFYDAEKGTGYLAWRLKTLSRKVFKRPVKEA